jgi:transmembrane 9 superfamily protein 2/4
VAAYIATFAVGFMLSKDSLAGFIPVFIYLSYMSILIVATYLALGAVGFVASWLFIRFIFGAVKSD